MTLHSAKGLEISESNFSQELEDGMVSVLYVHYIR